MFSLPTEPGAIGHTLDAGFKLYFVVFKRVLVMSILAALSVSLPMHVMVLLMPMFVAEGGGPGEGLIAALVIGFTACMVVYMWIYLAALYRIGGIGQGEDRTFGECMRVGGRKIFPVMIAAILYSLAMMGGFILLVVPGLILWVSLAFFGVCMVLDNDGIIESLRHSHRLVWGNWWRTAIIGTVVLIVYYVIYLAVEVPFAVADQMIYASELGALPGLGQTILSLIGDLIATVITFPLIIAVMIAVYHDLKLRKEGQDLEARVEALTASA